MRNFSQTITISDVYDTSGHFISLISYIYVNARD